MAKRNHSASRHYNIGQLRVDTWNRLRADVALLERSRAGSATEKRLTASVAELLQTLSGIERYFGYPGHVRLESLRRKLSAGEHTSLSNQVGEIVRQLVSDAYRSTPQQDADDEMETATSQSAPHAPVEERRRNYFEVLFVDRLTSVDEPALRDKLRRIRESDEPYFYEAVVQHSFQDALIALLFNPTIQAAVIRYGIPFKSGEINPSLRPFVQNLLDIDLESRPEADLGPLLGQYMHKFRPELDVYYVTDTALTHLKDSTLKNFRRIFYRKEDLQELHLTILRGIGERYETPFFTALKDYSNRPTGVFHAMPISRGNSVFKSSWIRDFGDFYGRRLFLAETSSTTGGLDSLLQPTGTLKAAQEKASQAYGSRQSFFVTNGTSTANKIVLQALVEPGDLVLVDRDCHKSHHYGLVLSGAFPVYLDSYPIPEYSMYGAVPLAHIRAKLLELKAAGRLDRVKMLLLTNCTFDGIVYNVERVMEEVLAIKPDMVFLWDEAWFAFAGFTYTYKQRTAMYTAAKLYDRYNSDSYRRRYKEHVQTLAPGEDPKLPDPNRVRIRAYATQSTHKTLSSFRQGSMIHTWDEEFGRRVAEPFHEAYMTHTSTSPNYQILASLDAGRRQVQFEGYELVEKAIEMAMILRARIGEDPRLQQYFDVLKARDLIPETYRASGLAEYYDPTVGWNRMERAWAEDEFVLDPTKITLFTGRTGIDGDTFKNSFLMNQFKIQVNKTSRNSVLLMTNIGTTRGSVAYLMRCLLTVTDQLEERFRGLNVQEVQLARSRIQSLTRDVPPLPDFSHFHASFQAVPGVPGGDLRKAYFLAYGEEQCDYIKLEECRGALSSGRELVSAAFVIPYPPGFPVLVPGQVLSRAIVDFLLALDVTEIHGLRPELGLRVFRDNALGLDRPGASATSINQAVAVRNPK